MRTEFHQLSIFILSGNSQPLSLHRVKITFLWPHFYPQLSYTFGFIFILRVWLTRNTAPSQARHALHYTDQSTPAFCHLSPRSRHFASPLPHGAAPATISSAAILFRPLFWPGPPDEKVIITETIKTCCYDIKPTFSHDTELERLLQLTSFI